MFTSPSAAFPSRVCATASGGKINVFTGGQGTALGVGFRSHRLGFIFAAADAGY